MRHVRLYGRPGCHLCDDAMTVVTRVRATTPFTLEVIDIETDDALMLRYLERIPVLSIDGTERFQFFVDETALRDALDTLGAR